VRPGHAAGVYQKFYPLDLGSPTIFYALGALELLRDLDTYSVASFTRRSSTS
jgi:hypothetical protein